MKGEGSSFLKRAQTSSRPNEVTEKGVQMPGTTQTDQSPLVDQI